MKKFYITTPIYYPSANLHLGHAYCTVATDVLARYKRLQGYDVHFLTGSDEHGEKIQKNAEAKGMEPIDFVDEIVANFKKLWISLDISNDDYIRTTEERHTKVVKKIFTRLINQGDIYKGVYKGWYCTPCESFWTNGQVKDEKVCPDCGRSVYEATEEAYFLRVGKYVPQLLEFYETHENFITPKSRLNEMINTFIKPGLDELCISRTSFSWGVQVEEDPRHIVYVWIDALINYISAIGYESDDLTDFNKFWGTETEIVHILGNDISRFHIIYWPILLFALGLRQPDRLFVHGLLMMKDGVKMSKSRGNVVSPFPLIERYGVDTLRYYLVSEMVFGQDGAFTPEQFVERVNADLANNFGNLLSRSTSMVVKYFNGIVPAYIPSLSANTIDLYNFGKEKIAEYQTYFDDLRITEAIRAAMDFMDKANKYIELQAPWTLAKDEILKDELASTMNSLINVIRIGAILLSPVLVKSVSIVLDQLNVAENERTFASINNFALTGGQEIKKNEALFPRLDKVIEIEEIKKMMN